MTVRGDVFYIWRLVLWISWVKKFFPQNFLYGLKWLSRTRLPNPYIGLCILWTIVYPAHKTQANRLVNSRVLVLGPRGILSNFSTLWTWTTPTNHEWFGTLKGPLLMAILINAVWCGSSPNLLWLSIWVNSCHH